MAAAVRSSPLPRPAFASLFRAATNYSGTSPYSATAAGSASTSPRCAQEAVANNAGRASRDCRQAWGVVRPVAGSCATGSGDLAG